MKIVDLRPLLVRSYTRSDIPPEAPRFLSKIAGNISDKIIASRVIKRPPAKGLPLLVSVGNLALGGTGKTPVVMALARDLSESGIKGAVLTRGYGSPLAGPFIVENINIQAGDEARMMAGRLEESEWLVIQSRNRPQGLEFIEKNYPELKVILLEDAFQTGGLKRHIDLVILDSWSIEEKPEGARLDPLTGSTFPFGPWRETAAGAKRASALLVESGDDLPDASVHSQPVFSFNRTVNLKQVHGSTKDRNFKNWGLVSGIARPEKFEISAAELLDGKVVLAMRCKDHAEYSHAIVRKFLKHMDETGATGLVTTAKDWVKLSGLWEDSRPVMVLEMELEWTQKEALNQWLVERLIKLEQDQSELTAP